MKRNQHRLLGNLLKRRFPPDCLVTPEISRALASVSHLIRRQVGMLVDRRGAVDLVLVGDARAIEIPEIKRARAGTGRLSGVRLVHTHLSSETLSQDDLTDLIVLRLDLICAIAVKKDGLPGGVQAAYLVPGGEGDKAYEVLSWSDVHAVEINPEETIRALEEELARGEDAVEVSGGAERAILVGVYDTRGPDSRVRMEELKELAATAGLNVVDKVTQTRAEIDPRYVMGKGKLEELITRAKRMGATLLVFDRNLSPSQIGNIAKATDQKVIDRTQLILDIFARHAHTWEGKIQVELAQLRYRLPFLTGKGTTFSRLTGGIGGLGPGETKLEEDRRLVKERIGRLQKMVDSLSESRVQKRALRKRQGLPVVSIVGYTNAGKSTLLNRLTGSSVYVADKLFATLDPTSRRLRFPDERDLIVTDTVGFIRDLPPDLVAAFRSTLEELREADLLLNVVDLSSPDREEEIRCVDEILGTLELDAIPKLPVFNKLDRVPSDEAGDIAVRHGGIAVSALHGVNLEELVVRIRRILEDRGKM